MEEERSEKMLNVCLLTIILVLSKCCAGLKPTDDLTPGPTLMGLLPLTPPPVHSVPHGPPPHLPLLPSSTSGSGCHTVLEAWAPCGGLKKCRLDAPCPRMCCTSGYKCMKKDPQLYVCTPSTSQPPPTLKPRFPFSIGDQCQGHSGDCGML